MFYLDSEILEYIREVIEDTDSGNYIFSDDFIEYIFNNKEENINDTIAELFLILSGKVIKSGVTSYTIGNESYSLVDASSKYLELSQVWKNKSSTNNVGVLMENNMNKDTDEEADAQSSFSYLMGDAYSAE